ncbi:hypothetical protein D9M71_732380 [compost metagenome]
MPICDSTKGRRANKVPSVNAMNIEPLSSRLKLLKNWSKYDILIPANNTPWNWPFLSLIRLEIGIIHSPFSRLRIAAPMCATDVTFC